MKIDFNELVAIAFLERSRRYNLKIKDSIRQKAKEAIERHNLTQEQINLIYKVFTGDSQAECNHPLPAGLSYPSNQTPTLSMLIPRCQLDTGKRVRGVMHDELCLLWPSNLAGWCCF